MNINKADAKTTDSPRSKTERLLKNQTVNDNVRKTLVFHHTMTKSIVEKYKNTESQKHRQFSSVQFSSNVVFSKLLKKYRLKKKGPSDICPSKKTERIQI